MTNKVKVNIDGLQKLKKMFATLPKVRVGVIGEKAALTHKEDESKEPMTNAQIAAVQEFGKKSNPKIPARSFIGMPIKLHLNDFLKQKQATSKKAMEKAIKDGKIQIFAKNVGTVAEECIQEAFTTRGFGNWKPNAPATIAAKGSDSPLIDTSELRRSVSSEVI